MNLTPQIREEKEQVEKLLKELRSLDPLTQSVLVSSMSQYICVRITGYLETGLDSLLITFVEQSTKDHRLRNVTIKYIQGFHSANYGNIRQLLAAFDKNLDESFKSQIDLVGKNIPENIDSLFKQRNLIAHGQRSELGTSALNQYFKMAQQVLEIIARLLN
jgi:hypothetical protein